MIKVYGIRNCNTMKKAFAWLDAKGVAYEFHDYRKAGAPIDHIDAWIARAGWETVLNTKGTTFRKLPRERQQDLDAAKAAALMRELPSSIKRPVIESGNDTLLIGFDAEAYEKALA
jgi:arsenate reductase